MADIARFSADDLLDSPPRGGGNGSNGGGGLFSGVASLFSGGGGSSRTVAEPIPLASSDFWLHPCFVDAVAADFVATHGATAADARLRATLGLGFAADLVAHATPSLPAALAPHAEPVEQALRRGAVLVPPVDSTDAGALHRFLSGLTAELRALPVGGAIVLPAGWSVRTQGAASVLLALHRAAEASWDMAVVSLSAGLAYHPQHAAPPHGHPAYDPALYVRGVPASRQVDSGAHPQSAAPHATPGLDGRLPAGVSGPAQP